MFSSCVNIGKNNYFRSQELYSTHRSQAHWADKICFDPPRISANLSPLNFQFVNRGRSEKQQNIFLLPSANHMDI